MKPAAAPAHGRIQAAKRGGGGILAEWWHAPRTLHVGTAARQIHLPASANMLHLHPARDYHSSSARGPRVARKSALGKTSLRAATSRHKRAV